MDTVDTSGHKWTQVDTHGHKWTQLDTTGHSYGHNWKHMEMKKWSFEYIEIDSITQIINHYGDLYTAQIIHV